MWNGWKGCAAVLNLLAAGTLGAVLACTMGHPKAEPPAQKPALPADYDPARSFAPLVEALQPAVVNVYVKQHVEVPDFGMPDGLMERFFFGPFGPFGPMQAPQDQGDEEEGWHGLGEQGRPWMRRFERQGQGSGFIISPDGYILTNNHVVEDADEVKVKLTDERVIDAKVVGTDPRIDVALIKVDVEDPLPYVELGSSEELRVGDWVVAIGNPFGLSHTVTAGIVSAKGRVIGAGPYDDFIQTDASINFGNSGGPLFNTQGQVVGINTAIVARGQGIAFAVPIDMVKEIMDELKTTGHVARGWIGVGLQPLDEDLAAGLGLESTEGAVIGQVYPGTPGEKAGLRQGDVVLSIDGTPVHDTEQLVRAVGEHKPGEKVELEVFRDGKKKTITVKLGERPAEEDLARGRYTVEQEESEESSQAQAGERRLTLEELGVRVAPARSVLRRSDLPGDVVVTAVKEDSPADGKLQPGDIVLEVNRKRVSTVEDVERALRRGNGEVVLFLVERDGVQRFVAVRVEED